MTATTRTRRAPQSGSPAPETLGVVRAAGEVLLTAAERTDGYNLGYRAYVALALLTRTLVNDPIVVRDLRRLRRMDRTTIDLILALGQAQPPVGLRRPATATEESTQCPPRPRTAPRPHVTLAP